MTHTHWKLANSFGFENKPKTWNDIELTLRFQRTQGAWQKKNQSLKSFPLKAFSTTLLD